MDNVIYTMYFYCIIIFFHQKAPGPLAPRVQAKVFTNIFNSILWLWYCDLCIYLYIVEWQNIMHKIWD